MSQKEHPKCIWTGKRDASVKPVTLQTLDRFTIPTEKTFHISGEYEQELYRFNEKYRKYGRFFLYTVICLTFLIIAVPLALAATGISDLILTSIGTITALTGILIVIFPFPTHETVHRLGLDSAQKLVRTAGYLTVLVGLAFGIIDLI